MDLNKTKTDRDTDAATKSGGCCGGGRDAKPAVETDARTEKTAGAPAPKSHGCGCGNH